MSNPLRKEVVKLRLFDSLGLAAEFQSVTIDQSISNGAETIVLIEGQDHLTFNLNMTRCFVNHRWHRKASPHDAFVFDQNHYLSIPAADELAEYEIVVTPQTILDDYQIRKLQSLIGLAFSSELFVF